MTAESYAREPYDGLGSPCYTGSYCVIAWCVFTCIRFVRVGSKLRSLSDSNVATALLGNPPIPVFHAFHFRIPEKTQSRLTNRAIAHWQHIMLIQILLLAMLPFSWALDCYNHPSDMPLPRLFHCYELIRAIFILSRHPDHTGEKIWGRGLPSNADTEEIPKTYIYAPAGQGPLTCALNLDADPLHPHAREVFRLQAVATAGSRIVDTCLAASSQIGRAPVGPTGRVFAKIVRSESPMLLQAAGVESITIPGRGTLLWMGRVENGSHDAMK